VVKEHGDADDGGWRWGSVRHANIMHLLRIPALSALLVPVQGGPSTLNPVSEAGGFGPSWRMVVEMGPEVHAMGTYPGGQSGNPASARYLAHLVTWSKGELDTLRFPKSEADLDRRTVTSVLTLTPAAK
jgi:penicillin amidase